LVDTGDVSMTGGRLRRVKDFLKGEELFCFTYGDGLSSVNITDSIKFHQNSGKLATLTAVFPPGRFGALEIENTSVKRFKEKPRGDGAFINGGFFVLSPEVIDYIHDDACVWEQEPLTRLSELDQLQAFQHDGFWQPMDTLRDKIYLEELWNSNKAPWRTW
jgi:glucose-1-phosphate cytidylyltransferase